MELLIVITIIAMLSAMTLVVVGHAQRLARISATETTIARIDEAVCEMYEGYMYRRVEAPSNPDPAVSAGNRLLRLYDTVRMEMPNNWEEVVYPPQFGQEDSTLRQVYLKVFQQAVVAAGGTAPIIKPYNPSIPNAYDIPSIDIDYSSTSPHYTIRRNEEAKLLYQVVMNGNPETREMFGDKGIAILDEDGLPCFVDAWGRPIYFLRWGPGFNGSDRQPNMYKWTGFGEGRCDCGGSGCSGDYSDHWEKKISPDNIDVYSDTDPFSVHKMVRERYPDPLDIAGVRKLVAQSGSNPPRAFPGWFLVPLVYSAGPDGKYDIATPEIDTAKGGTGRDKLILDPFQREYGAPFGSDGGELDNIHNHRLGGR